MHPALSIPLIVEKILAYVVSTHGGKQRGFQEHIILQKKYLLAGVCQTWKSIILPHIYDELHVYVKARWYTREEPGVSGDSENSESDEDWPHFSTNLGIIPPTAKPRKIVLYYDYNHKDKVEVRPKLQEIGFEQRDWRSVRSLVLELADSIGELNLVSGIGVDVSYILFQCPHLESIILLNDSYEIEDMDALTYLPRIVTNNITQLDLGSVVMCDLSDMALPALEDLTVGFEHHSGIHWLPAFDSSVIRRLRLKKIKPGDFFNLLQHTATGVEVNFSRLDTLDVLFDPIVNYSSDDTLGGTQVEGRESPQFTYSFPRLHDLTLSDLRICVNKVCRLFRNAPLEMLKLIGCNNVLAYFDIAKLPSLRSIQSGECLMMSNDTMAAAMRNFVEPVSRLERLSICSRPSPTLRCTSFGCTNIRALDICILLTIPQLEALLTQSLHLAKLNVFCDINQSSTNRLSVEFANIVDSKEESLRPLPEPLSTSLQDLVFNACGGIGYVYPVSEADGPTVAMGIIARIPSLLKMWFNFDSSESDTVIRDMLNDPMNLAAVPHLANVDLDSNRLSLMNQILSE